MLKSRIKLTIALIIFTTYSCLSQSSLLGNSYPGFGTPYLGWDNTNAYDLDIVNENTYNNINFYTDAGAGAPWNNLRMCIGYNGFIGFGDLPNPQRFLHAHSGSSDNFFHMTTKSTTIGGGRGFSIELNNNDQRAVFHQNEAAPLQVEIVDGYYNAKVLRAEFTARQAMIENEPARNRVDGFRIWNPGYAHSHGHDPLEALDLWTGESHSTHIRFDGSGLIQGLNLRFEQFARLNGFWFNAAPLANQIGYRGNYRFNIDSIEVMRIGNASNSSRGFTRIGLEPLGGPVDAARRLEVYDNSNFPQFRLTHDDAINFTDFLVKGNGDLIISPLSNGNPAKVGIGTSIPLATLHVFLGNNTLTSAYGAQFDTQNSYTNNINTIGVHSITKNTVASTTYGAVFDTENTNIGTSTTIGVQALTKSSTNTSGSIIKGIYSNTVGQNSNQILLAGHFEATGASQESYGINAVSNTTATNNIGVLGSAVNSSPTYNKGLEGYAKNAVNNYGAKCSAYNGINSYGIYVEANGGANNYGIYAGTPVGVISSTNTAGYFNGNTYCSGNFVSSDFKLKKIYRH